MTDTTTSPDRFRLALMEAEIERQVEDLTPKDARDVRAVLLAYAHKLWQPGEVGQPIEEGTLAALVTEAERRLIKAGVCLSDLPWCSSCDTDVDDSIYHRTTITASDLLDVKVCQVTYSSTVEPSVVEPEFDIQVHDEPSLTAEQALQVAAEIVASVERVRG